MDAIGSYKANEADCDADSRCASYKATHGHPINSWCLDLNDLSFLFYNTIFNEDISSWDVSSVTNMWGMFLGSTFNRALSSWDVSGVANMREMFHEASAFNQDLSSWDMSSIQDTTRMFYQASAFNQNLCSWGTYTNFFALNTEIFENSGCSTKTTPADSDGPICGSSTC